MNRGTLWIGFVVALLAGNVVAMGVLYTASGDPEGRVLPDYYRKGAAYDDVMAEERASLELGWRAQPSLRGSGVEVQLADRDGAPIAGATVTVTVDPRGRADRTEAATLVEAAPGVYRGDVAAGARGLYVVAVRAERGEARFVASATVER